jgi:hypothetical protein
MQRRRAVGLISIAVIGALIALTPLRAHAESPMILVQQSADKPHDNSPEARMNSRFPQKVRVGDLIGLPVLDDNDVTLGNVQKVVRTPEGKIRLIVSYSRWFGWFGRPVTVPIEAVVILGRQIDSVDMQPEEYEKALTWSAGNDQTIADDEIIRIALGRR